MTEFVLPSIDTPPPQADAGQPAQGEFVPESAPGMPLPEDRATPDGSTVGDGTSQENGQGAPALSDGQGAGDRSQKRFDKLTREAKEASRAAEQATRELAIEREVNRRMREASSGMPQPGAQARPQGQQQFAPPVEPRREDFAGNPDGYYVAQARWASQMEFYNLAVAAQRANRVAAKAAAEQASVQQVVTAVNKVQRDLTTVMQQQGPERYTDYADVISAATDTVPLNVQLAISQSADPVGVTYYLAKHQDIIPRLEKLSPFQLGATIGRVAIAMKPAASESSFGSESFTPPPPGRPAGGRAGNPMGYREDFTPEQHQEWERSRGIR